MLGTAVKRQHEFYLLDKIENCTTFSPRNDTNDFTMDIKAVQESLQ